MVRCETLSLFAGFSSEEEAPPPPKPTARTYMNQPHLRFEITSDDGFSVKANSIEGRNHSSASYLILMLVFSTLCH